MAQAVAQPAPVQAPHFAPAANVPAGGGGSAKAFLNVICIPRCDRVELDGVPLGPTPVIKYSASVGSHRIKLISSNPPATKTVSKIVVADTINMVRESMP